MYCMDRCTIWRARGAGKEEQAHTPQEASVKKRKERCNEGQGVFSISEEERERERKRGW
jgi:hypothetical protein